MSRVQSLQEPGQQSPRYPWYYKDVPGWVIVAFVLAVAGFATMAVVFQPLSAERAITVVAPGDKAPPWKAPIPQQLPMPSFPAIPPPVIPPSAPPNRSAIDAILSKGVSLPQPPEKVP